MPYPEKSFRNLIESNRNQIVFTIFGLIWIETDVRLDLNYSEIGKYILIWKRFLCVHDRRKVFDAISYSIQLDNEPTRFPVH